jgi:hypothetical protein
VDADGTSVGEISQFDSLTVGPGINHVKSGGSFALCVNVRRRFHFMRSFIFSVREQWCPTDLFCCRPFSRYVLTHKTTVGERLK